jgi:hypothetical protein
MDNDCDRLAYGIERNVDGLVAPNRLFLGEILIVREEIVGSTAGLLITKAATDRSSHHSCG